MDMNYYLRNRSWMYNRRPDDMCGVRDEYIAGVEQFLQFAKAFPHYMDGTKIKCPCVKCHNVKYYPEVEVTYHLYSRGFTPNYYQWTAHGELVSLASEPEPYVEPYMHAGPNFVSDNHTYDDGCVNMVFDAAGPSFIHDAPEEAPNVDVQSSWSCWRMQGLHCILVVRIIHRWRWLHDC